MSDNETNKDDADITGVTEIKMTKTKEILEALYLPPSDPPTNRENDTLLPLQ